MSWVAGPVGMSLSLVTMQLTATTHPPGRVPGMPVGLSVGIASRQRGAGRPKSTSAQPLDCTSPRTHTTHSHATPAHHNAAGGATALIAATLPTLPRWHGYSFLVTVGVGSLVMQLIALVVNNLDPGRRYPTFWW